mgnify:CR=1 FL=1
MFAAPLNSRTFLKVITKNFDKRTSGAFAKESRRLLSKWILLEFSAGAAAEAVAVGTRAAGTAVVLDGVVRFGLGGVGVGVHHQRHFGKRRHGAEQAQQQGRKQRKPFLFYTLFSPFKAEMQAGSSAEH